MTLEMFAKKEKDAAEKVKELEKREEELQEKEEARTRREDELKRGEERLQERERQLEAERVRREERENGAANGLGNDFEMGDNNASNDRLQDRPIDDAEPTGGMSFGMDMDFDNQCGK